MGFSPQIPQKSQKIYKILKIVGESNCEGVRKWYTKWFEKLFRLKIDQFIFCAQLAYFGSNVFPAWLNGFHELSWKECTTWPLSSIVVLVIRPRMRQVIKTRENDKRLDDLNPTQCQLLPVRNVWAAGLATWRHFRGTRVQWWTETDCLMNV